MMYHQSMVLDVFGEHLLGPKCTDNNGYATASRVYMQDTHPVLEDNVPSLDKVCVCRDCFYHLSPSKSTLEIYILGI